MFLTCMPFYKASRKYVNYVWKKLEIDRTQNIMNKSVDLQNIVPQRATFVQAISDGIVNALNQAMKE